MSFSYRFREYVKRNKKAVHFFGLLFISSATIFLNSTLGLSKVQEAGFTAVSNVQGFISGIGSWFGQTIASIDELRRLKEDYNQAKEKLATYAGLERNLVKLEQENRSLREQLQFAQTLEFSHLPAQVIGHDPSNFYSTITINKGYMDGVREEMPVIAFQNGIFGLVGKVIEAGWNTSVIKPIMDSTMFISSRFQKSRYEGLVVGKGNNEDKLLMQYVKKIAKPEISLNDLVVTSGYNSLYPKGLTIGRVSHLSSKDYETSLDIELEPVINFSKIEYVFLLKGDR